MDRLSGVSLSSMFDTIGQRTDISTDRLSRVLNKTGGSPTDMIKIQVQLHMWSSAIQLESSVVKAVGDVLKSVIQKMN